MACCPDCFLASSFPNLSGSCLLDLPNDLVEVRPFAGGEFGMELFAIGGDFKGAATRRNEGESADAIAEFENLGRQTDGLRRVVSDHAVLDPDFGFHVTLLSEIEPSGWEQPVKL
jgi:hypothetical protein